jgi:hypothetical protein
MEHDPERLPAIDANALRMKVNLVEKISPSSLTVCEFRDLRDIKIVESFYHNISRLGDLLVNAWNVKLRMGDYHLTNDSDKFEFIENLLPQPPNDAWELILNLSKKNFFPVYEGKNCWFYDSRVISPKLTVHSNDTNEISFENPRVGFRRIASSTNERTLVPCIIPANTLCTYGIIFADDNIEHPLTYPERMFFASLLGSFVLDFILRFQITTTISNSNGYALPIKRLNGKKDEFEALVARVSR